MPWCAGWAFQELLDEEPWGFARGFRSLFKWPQYNAAPPLPPLTSSGLRGLHESGQDDGGVHRPSVSHPVLTGTNDRCSARARQRPSEPACGFSVLATGGALNIRTMLADLRSNAEEAGTRDQIRDISRDSRTLRGMRCMCILLYRASILR